MLWTSFVALLVLWTVALLLSVTFSGFIHVLPLTALVVAVVGNVQARPII